MKEKTENNSSWIPIIKKLATITIPLFGLSTIISNFYHSTSSSTDKPALSSLSTKNFPVNALSNSTINTIHYAADQTPMHRLSPIATILSNLQMVNQCNFTNISTSTEQHNIPESLQNNSIILQLVQTANENNFHLDFSFLDRPQIITPENQNLLLSYFSDILSNCISRNTGIIFNNTTSNSSVIIEEITIKVIGIKFGT